MCQHGFKLFEIGKWLSECDFDSFVHWKNKKFLLLLKLMVLNRIHRIRNTFIKLNLFWRVVTVLRSSIWTKLCNRFRNLLCKYHECLPAIKEHFHRMRCVFFFQTKKIWLFFCEFKIEKGTAHSTRIYVII